MPASQVPAFNEALSKAPRKGWDMRQHGSTKDQQMSLCLSFFCENSVFFDAMSPKIPKVRDFEETWQSTSGTCCKQQVGRHPSSFRIWKQLRMLHIQKTMKRAGFNASGVPTMAAGRSSRT